MTLALFINVLIIIIIIINAKAYELQTWYTDGG